jgi:hypothetical protein
MRKASSSASSSEARSVRTVPRRMQDGPRGHGVQRRESTYIAGRSPNWIKVKKRSHPALVGSRSHSHERQPGGLRLWWKWATKPLDSSLTLDTAIHDAVMALPREERLDRAKSMMPCAMVLDPSRCVPPGLRTYMASPRRGNEPSCTNHARCLELDRPFFPGLSETPCRSQTRSVISNCAGPCDCVLATAIVAAGYISK